MSQVIPSSHHRRIKKWVLHAEPKPPNFKVPGPKAEVSPCELSHHVSPAARETTTGQIEFSVKFHCKMAASICCALWVIQEDWPTAPCSPPSQTSRKTRGQGQCLWFHGLPLFQKGTSKAIILVVLTIPMRLCSLELVIFLWRPGSRPAFYTGTPLTARVPRTAADAQCGRDDLRCF